MSSSMVVLCCGVGIQYFIWLVIIWNYICITLESTWLFYNWMDDFITFKINEFSEGDINELPNFSCDIRLEVRIWSVITGWINVQLTEAHFVEAMLDVEIGDSRPGKGQPLNGSVDVNFLGCFRGGYILFEC